MDLFNKKIKCGTCGKKVKDKNLAWIHINCEDGVVKSKICNDCEKKFNERVEDGRTET